MTNNDPVNRPAHYTSYPVEVIELTEHMNFCRGNAVKYIARAGLKDPATEVEDLRKAAWYIQREIDRLNSDTARTARGARYYVEEVNGRWGVVATDRPGEWASFGRDEEDAEYGRIMCARGHADELDWSPYGTD